MRENIQIALHFKLSTVFPNDQMGDIIMSCSKSNLQHSAERGQCALIATRWRNLVPSCGEQRTSQRQIGETQLKLRCLFTIVGNIEPTSAIVAMARFPDSHLWRRASTRNVTNSFPPEISVYLGVIFDMKIALFSALCSKKGKLSPPCPLALLCQTLQWWCVFQCSIRRWSHCEITGKSLTNHPQPNKIVRHSKTIAAGHAWTWKPLPWFCFSPCFGLSPFFVWRRIA